LLKRVEPNARKPGAGAIRCGIEALPEPLDCTRGWTRGRYRRTRHSRGLGVAVFNRYNAKSPARPLMGRRGFWHPALTASRQGRAWRRE